MKYGMKWMAAAFVVAAMLPGRAGANGIIIVPTLLQKSVPTGAVEYSTVLVPKLQPNGVWCYVPTTVATPVYQQVQYAGLVIIPNPIKPCYKPPTPTPPPPPRIITPSPQSPTAAPQSAAAPDAHDHAAEKPGGCGSCFPECFVKLPCTCCEHDIVALKPDDPRTKYWQEMVAKQYIAHRPISGYKDNGNGTYTIEP